MNKPIDMMGLKIGRLSVLKRIENNKNGRAMWLCKCECGKEKEVSGVHLRRKMIRSCGCLHNEGNNFKHGHAKVKQETRTYRIWKAIKHRCNNPNDKYYYCYGGRGIQVCDRWLNKDKGYLNFLEDMQECPGKKYSIDRIDNDGNYYKENCRWATTKEQQRNTRRTHYEIYKGKKQCIAELSEKHEINSQTITGRLKIGWSLEKSLTTPVRKSRPLTIRDYEQQLGNALRKLKSKDKDKIGFSKYLPYNSRQLHDHLENIKNLQNNSCPMCHISYEIKPFDIDHIVPTSSAKTKEDLLKLFDLKNLSLLCWHCNRHIKRDKILNENL